MEARLARLEWKVELVRSDAAAVRILASGAHEDVVKYRQELKADARTLSALRETQMEHSQILHKHSETLREQSETLREHGELLREHSETLATLQTEMREGFATQAVGQREITQLLTRIIDEGK